jgi:hypothetical protein
MNWAIPQAYDNVDFHLVKDSPSTDSPSTASWHGVAYYDQVGGDNFDIPNLNIILAYGHDIE